MTLYKYFLDHVLEGGVKRKSQKQEEYIKRRKLQKKVNKLQNTLQEFHKDNSFYKNRTNDILKKMLYKKYEPIRQPVDNHVEIKVEQAGSGKVLSHGLRIKKNASLKELFKAAYKLHLQLNQISLYKSRFFLGHGGEEITNKIGTVQSIFENREKLLIFLPGIRKIVKCQNDEKIDTIAFNSDGKILATVSDVQIKLWDTVNGNLIRTFAESHDFSIRSMAFSADDQLLASGSEDQTIKLWNTKDGSLVRTLTEHDDMAHDDYISSVAISPDGTRIASGSLDTTIKLWNTEDGSLIQTLQGDCDEIVSVAFTLDGKIVSVHENGTSILWNEDGSCSRTLKWHSLPLSMAMNPDGRSFAVSYMDGTVKLWNLGFGRRIFRTFNHGKLNSGYSNVVQSIAFSKDGKLLVTIAQDKRVRVFDVNDGSIKETFGPFQNYEFFHDKPSILAFSSDYRIAIAINKTVMIGDY